MIQAGRSFLEHGLTYEPRARKNDLYHLLII